MAIPYLKSQPEEAIQILDKLIVDGYRLKDQINTEYKSKRMNLDQNIIDTWKNLVNDWTISCINELKTIFVSEKESFNFRDAAISPTGINGENIYWNSINNQISARIGKLNEYDQFIVQHFHINIEVVGRDKIVQNGYDAAINISN